MKKVMGKLNKKAATVIVAGTVVVGSLGGGAYAYKDEWTAKIQSGVSQLADYIFKGDIQTAVKTYGDEKESKLKADANSLITSVMNELKQFKQDEINRGKAELDAKYNSDVKKITNVANQAKNNEKAEQKAKTDQAVSNAKNDMDAVIEEYLNKIK
jgi:hypothetical protein